MERFTRSVMLAAAAWNTAVAAGLVLLREPLAPLLALEPITGTNLLIFHVGAALIAAFGYAYWRAATDPRRYRAYIELGILAKSLVGLAGIAVWAAAGLDWRLPALTLADLVFVALFVRCLRETASAPG